MKILIAHAAIVLLYAGPALGQMQESEIVRAQAAIVGIAEMDAELKTLRDHQTDFRERPALLKDEYESLILRYPGISVRQNSSFERMYKALFDVRSTWAIDVGSIVRQALAKTNVHHCQNARQLRASFDNLFASEKYKRADAEYRVQLRLSIESALTSNITLSDCPS